MVDLNSLTDAELAALESGARKLRERKAQALAAAQSGPNSYRVTTHLRIRRNGQTGIALSCPSRLDAIEEAKEHAAIMRVSEVILVGADQSFDQVARAVGDSDAIFVVAEKVSFNGFPIRQNPPAPPLPVRRLNLKTQAA
jgi:hypothetical protein